ncbi:MAG: DNA repair protein RecO [Chloroflexi bacterium]|nr:DNA repair protein RecO [Chloroflexota bacterium]
MPSRERTFRTEAIVLRRKDFGEADRVLTLFTPEAGKIRAIAKGVRKPASRKAGHLELYTRSNVLLAKGRDMDIITQAETVQAYRPLREDLLRSTYGSYCIELLDQFTPDEAENKPLYDLLTQALGWLAEARDLALATRYYELQLLGMAGYQLELFYCVVKGEKIAAEDQFFSPAEGGAVCPACGENRQGAFPISLNALKVLRFMIRSPYDALRELKLSASAHHELERVTQRTITYHLERQLKSVEFLKQVRQTIE